MQRTTGEGSQLQYLFGEHSSEMLHGRGFARTRAPGQCDASDVQVATLLHVYIFEKCVRVCMYVCVGGFTRLSDGEVQCKFMAALRDAR
jgi:hypothetical protein